MQEVYFELLQITGGSSGIGKCLAVQALKKGAAVVSIVARNEVQLRPIAHNMLSHVVYHLRNG